MNSTVTTLWRGRELMRALTIANLKLVNKNTFLGYLWWLIDPIMMTAVYTIVVGFVLGRGRVHQPYPAFLMCGVVFWKSFSSTVSQSIDTIAKSEGLIKSYSFPKAVLPISLVLSNQILFAFALIPLMMLTLFYQFIIGTETVHVGWTLVYLPLIWAAQMSVTLGAALMFSCFGVFFKDLGNIMSHVLRVGWYLSPGLYAITDILKGYKGVAHTPITGPLCLYLLNPFAYIMEGYRDAIVYGRTPDLGGLLYTLLVGAVSIFLGLRVFQGQERKFAKFV